MSCDCTLKEEFTTFCFKNIYRYFAKPSIAVLDPDLFGQIQILVLAISNFPCKLMGMYWLRGCGGSVVGDVVTSDVNVSFFCDRKQFVFRFRS
jgi:hypothetical protein